jgi:hypothetical protein
LGEQCLFDLPTYPSPHIQIEGIRTLWNEHQTKTHNHTWALWTLMSLQYFSHRMKQAVPEMQEEQHVA